MLRRAGHTEAAVDLAKMAGMFPAGVICEVMNADGTMARLPGARSRGARARPEAHLDRGPDRVPAPTGRCSWPRSPRPRSRPRTASSARYAYESLGRRPDPRRAGARRDRRRRAVLTRVHSECLTGDVFGSLRCDCGSQLDRALAMIGEEGRGVVLYVRGHEGRAIGLTHKLRAYELQDQGRDTVEANLELGFPADQRDYGIGAQILADLGRAHDAAAHEQPAEARRARGYGLAIDERVPLRDASRRRRTSSTCARSGRSWATCWTCRMPGGGAGVP